MNIINDLFQNGSLWALIGTIIYIFKEFQPLLKSHLRNNHEKSLLLAVSRIIPSVEKVVDASPSDRRNEALAELNEFASKRKIPLNQKLAEQWIAQGISDYFKDSNTDKNTPKVSVDHDGSVKEDNSND